MRQESPSGTEHSARMILEISQPTAVKDKAQSHLAIGEVEVQRMNRFAWDHRGGPKEKPDILNLTPAHSPQTSPWLAKDANSTVTRGQARLPRVET